MINRFGANMAGDPGVLQMMTVRNSKYSTRPCSAWNNPAQPRFIVIMGLALRVSFNSKNQLKANIITSQAPPVLDKHKKGLMLSAEWCLLPLLDRVTFSFFHRVFLSS